MNLEDYLMRADQIDWDLKTPCADCPFLKTTAYHQGVANNLQTNMEAIDAGNFAHTCHKTDSREPVDGPKTWTGRPKHCAGALMMLLKTGRGKDLQRPLIQALSAGKFDVHDMTRRAKADKRVFTVRGMLRFYLKEIQKSLGHD